MSLANEALQENARIASKKSNLVDARNAINSQPGALTPTEIKSLFEKLITMLETDNEVNLP